MNCQNGFNFMLNVSIDFLKGLVLIDKPNFNSFSQESVKMGEDNKKVFDTDLLNMIFSNHVQTTEMPLQTFYSILNESLENNFSSPLLPFGTIFFQKKGGHFLLLMECQEAKFNLSYAGMPQLYKYNTYSPKVYFLFCIPSNFKEGSISLTKTYIFTSDNNIEKINLEKLYYSSVLPNYSYTYGTGVCWGNGELYNLTRGNIKNLNDLESFPSKYFNSVFNTDLFPNFSLKKFCETIYVSLSDADKEDFMNFFIENYRENNSSDAASNIQPNDVNSFFENLRNNYNTKKIYILFIVYYTNKYSTFPYFILQSFDKMNSPIKKFLDNPLG